GRHAAPPAHAGHVYDGRLLPLGQDGDGTADQFRRCEEVRLHDLPQDGLGAGTEVPETGDAGVVDQHVQPAEAFDGGVQHAGTVFLAGDVTDDGQDVALDLGGQSGEFVG